MHLGHKALDGHCGVYVLTLGVAPAARNRGIALSLLGLVAQHAEQMRCARPGQGRMGYCSLACQRSRCSRERPVPQLPRDLPARDLLQRGRHAAVRKVRLPRRGAAAKLLLSCEPTCAARAAARHAAACKCKSALPSDACRACTCQSAGTYGPDRAASCLPAPRRARAGSPTPSSSGAPALCTAVPGASACACLPLRTPPHLHSTLPQPALGHPHLADAVP
jgi:hypothetical protein